MKKNSTIFSLLLLAVFVLTGCYSNRQIGLLQERDGIPTYDSVP